MDNITLYLLRHGESQANVDRIFAARKINPPLTEQGIKQAEAQSEALRDITFSAIYASPLLRTCHTAKIINKYHGHEIRVSEDLYEVNVGDLDGENQTDPEKWSKYLGIINKWGQRVIDAGFPNGETLADVKKRFESFISKLDGDNDKPVLIVGHCVLFMAFFWLFCKNHGIKIEDNNMRRGHLSIVSGNSDGYAIQEFNIFPGK